MAKKRTLGAGERDIMQVIWDAKAPLTAKQIQQAIQPLCLRRRLLLFRHQLRHTLPGSGQELFSRQGVFRSAQRFPRLRPTPFRLLLCLPGVPAGLGDLRL